MITVVLKWPEPYGFIKDTKRIIKILTYSITKKNLNTIFYKLLMIRVLED